MAANTRLVNVIEARELSNQGVWIINKNYDSTSKHVPFSNLPKFFKANYSILWPANIHDPIEKQYALITEI